MELVAGLTGTAMPGLRRWFGGRPGLLLAGTGLVAAGPLPGSLAILKDVRASMAGRAP